ncbi:MAG: DegT/DnrJ/EryC1/StrS family aminotransferase, partial [Flavobacterium sp.]|nr:DegT/DnrJ/EryC1/StrS family aminotransferase [Flavobacterium sp.]
MKKIPFFDYPKLYLSQKNRMNKVINSVIRRGAYILQDDLIAFEDKLAEYTNSKYAIGVANGTDAIWLSLLAADIGSGDEVIVPSHTYIASPAAIKFVGAEPILAECAIDHLLDSNDIQKRITSKTKAIMPVQLNGRTCEMDKIQKIADENNLLIIEDAAQGLGSLYKNRMAGTFGLAGTYSFYPAKVLGCFGDGGAVVTDDDNIYQKVYEMRDHGRDNSGEHVSWGFNSRLDNLQAAILLEKFKTFEDDIRLRRKIASLY